MDSTLFSPEKRFSSESLPLFIENLNKQMEDDSLYSLENNVAILKLYLLFPKTVDISIYEKILVKSLTQIPQPDFDICLFQMPISIKQDPVVVNVINLYNLLQDCKFKDFWTSLKNSKLADNKAVINGARNFALDVISLSYHKISIADFISLLDLDTEEEAKTLVAQQEWQIVDNFILINSNLDIKYTKHNLIEEHMKPESVKQCLNLIYDTGNMPR